MTTLQEDLEELGRAWQELKAALWEAIRPPVVWLLRRLAR